MHDLIEEMAFAAGLWREASFPRLPPDAPSQLDEYVEDIENPYRVYVIHRAARRHDFQQVVDRFITQLRYGCGDDECATATCFTCRRRLSGKKPTRTYNTTSARTLAVYLASQDDPLRGMCPSLLSYRHRHRTTLPLNYCTSGPPATAETSSKIKAQKYGVSDTSARNGDSEASDGKPSKSKRVRLASRTPEPRPKGETQSRRHCVPQERVASSNSEVSITERPANRDHRSFAATMFGTMAFKMVEWLVPHNLDDISQRIMEITRQENSDPHSSRPSQGTSISPPEDIDRYGDEPDRSPEPGTAVSENQGHPLPAALGAPRARKEPSTRRNSLTPRRSSAKPSRRRSGEPLSNTLRQDDDAFKLQVKPTVSPDSPPEKVLWQQRPGNGVIARGLPEMPSRPAFFENVSAPLAPVQRIQSSPEHHKLGENENEPLRASKPKSKSHSQHLSKTKTMSGVSSTATEPIVSRHHYPSPQTLGRLNPTLIGFIYDTTMEDGTMECSAGFDHPFEVPKPSNYAPTLRRTGAFPLEERRSRWKLFNDQAIFTVLSDPKSLLRSFTSNGELYDSHSLWYCMLRLLRVAPSLVFHSLWISAGALLKPSGIARSGNAHDYAKPSSASIPLQAKEAGQLLSICLHVLVAAASISSNSRSLYEMSRIRSHGLVLAVGGLGARQAPATCLAYEDVFANDLALRLARRLFRALNAQRIFAEMSRDAGSSIKISRSDILRPLLEQLDLLEGPSTCILQFSTPERLLHESRVPTLLLDWARAVLLQDWNGQATFSTDSAFGGALSFLATMYENRHTLLLGDIQFRVDYFSERLDPVEMPVTWLTFRRTPQRRHLLEYPYIFSPEVIVSFFRSINFSRMSRMFEESSSLKTRMGAIVDPGSLITNPHHKVVLQDLLKTASAKYLILEIGRQNVLRDSFDQLWRRERRELLRPLKVHLGEESGEEGFDSGGVQQEFFRLAIAECLDPVHGAFVVDERTRMAWFAPGSLVPLWKFELMGLLVSLAVFNGLTLPVTFPRALYRKLLGEPVQELHHIADGWPELVSGLSTLLEWDEKDGAVEDVFARTYEFTVPHFEFHLSQTMTRHQVWPQGLHDPVMYGAGEEAPLVTNNNRDDFVNDYIKYLTDVSVRPQFEAFQQGFHTCLEPDSISLLNPPILQSIVEGVQDIDISELKRFARYVGWESSHHTIRDFWSIVKRYDDRMKRKLLEFVTASDRVPVGGIRNLQFVIQKNGEEDGSGGHLPTAYTCYGTLLLPEYRDKDVLRERLEMALENAQGFGFA